MKDGKKYDEKYAENKKKGNGNGWGREVAVGQKKVKMWPARLFDLLIRDGQRKYWTWKACGTEQSREAGRKTK